MIKTLFRFSAANLTALFIFGSTAAASDVNPAASDRITGGDELFFADVFSSTGNSASTKLRLGVDIGAGPFSVSQSGAWTTGRTWTLSSGTDSIGAVESGTWNITNITGTVSLPTGASTSALQTSGNAMLATIDAGIPAALGQTTMSASMPVAIASDQTSLRTHALLTSGSVYGNLSVGTTAAEVRVGASKLTGRCNVTFMVIDTQTCYYGWSSAVTSSIGIPVFQNQNISIDVDANATIYIICTAASKNARIAENPCQL